MLSFQSLIGKTNFIWHYLDPPGRPKVMVGKYHYCHTWCRYVGMSDRHLLKFCKTKQLPSESSDNYWRNYGSG